MSTKNNPNPQSAPEGVLIEAGSGSPHAAEQVNVIPKNGAMNAQQVPVAQVPQGKAIDASSLDPAALDFYADVVAEKNPALAGALRTQKYDTTLTGGFKRLLSHRVTAGDIIIVSGVGLGVFLLWEGLAYKLDWPRAGLFDPSNPLKALPKK